MPGRQGRLALTAALILCLAKIGASEARDRIALGSKKFTESYVLAEIATTLLERAGFEVTHRQGMGGSVILWQALLHGDIALYPEYTGTIDEEILKARVSLTAEERRAALASRGIGISEDLGFNDGYALAMTRSRAGKLGIERISDLRTHADLRGGLTPEFMGRQDGWTPLLARYGLTFATIRGIEHGLGYAALANGQIDFKDCYTTDARIAVLDLVALKDDLDFFPQYRAVILYRIDSPSDALRAVRAMEGSIGETKMIALNRIAEETQDYALAAQSYFSAGVVRPEKRTGTRKVMKLLAGLPRLTAQHVTLVGISMALAILVSIPLGVLASKPGVVSSLILSGTGVIQTIPSLALLALMIPLFGIGQLPAIIALFLYSLLPIVRNTATGLQSVPRGFREAADAFGLPPRLQLLRIRLPLASPSILAGIKTSAVIAVGNATLAGLIGGGGYGEPIQSGLQLNDNATILQGAIPAALLAVAVQIGFSAAERVIVPKGLRSTRS